MERRQWFGKRGLLSFRFKKAGFSRLFHSGVKAGLVIFEEKTFCGMDLWGGVVLLEKLSVKPEMVRVGRKWFPFGTSESLSKRINRKYEYAG